MKKALAAICLLTFIASGIAQEDKKGFSLSLESGFTISNMYGPDVESETFLNGSPDNFYANHPASDRFKSGFNMSLLLDYRFSKFFSIGLGAGYIQKGASINALNYWSPSAQQYEEVNGNILWKQNFWTLEIPVSVYIPVNKNDIYFQAGLFQGFLINSEESGEISIDGDSGYEYVNERRANQKESGYFLGAGYLHSFSNTKSNIYAEIIWARSLQSPGRDIIPHSQRYFNQSISLNIGYRHKLNF